MSVCRIPSFTRHSIVSRCGSIRELSLKATKINCFRYFASSADTNYKSGGLWNFTKRWEFCVPIGLGISLVAILQWRHRRKYPYPNSDVVKGPISDFIVDCYCSLPLRITSRIFGWFASIEIPKVFRPILYKLYAKTFHANLDEIDSDLASFPSLVEFFVRPLKDNARPVAQHSEIVSPSDGTVLHFGPVTSCRVEQVKGITYNLRHFLGDVKLRKTEFTPEENDSYVNTLLTNPDNQLYELIVYLAPGDYHRFHSATNWKISSRRHFQGKLLSVNPKVASWLPDLFALNERAVYLGKWSGGFMAYAAVGATNVGSIKVFCDETLTTNERKWPKGKRFEETNFDYITFDKGELFGEFRMGSTIVLLFEAPKNLNFAINIGQSIKVGQALTISPIQQRTSMTS